MLTEAIAVMENEVYPAWQAAMGVLESQRPAATDDAGLWRFEEGEALYAQRLRAFTTTDLTAEEIHAIGLREVDRIETEMEALFRSVGYVEGTIAEREEQLSADLSYPNIAEGRQQIMADIEEILADALSINSESESRACARPLSVRTRNRSGWGAVRGSGLAPARSFSLVQF